MYKRQAALGKELGMRVHGGFSLNIFNTSALCWFAEFGLEDVELSFELTLPQVSAIGGTLPRGLVTYGSCLLYTSNGLAQNFNHEPDVFRFHRNIPFCIVFYVACYT